MTKNVAGAHLLARVEEFIGSDLLEVEEIFRRELASQHACVSDVFAHVTRFRGKRLRPILLLLSASAAGEINHDHRVLAAVVEMIHTATLVHDDVLDEADTRRHVATVNSRWNNETSVLFGDFLFTHAFHLAASLESTMACRVIGRATNIVCEGELTQIHHRGNFDLDEQTYLQMIDGKTAELCAVCCRLGAHYAGVDEEATAALESYGRNLGIAFQIADDLLDVLGDEQEAGKSLGTDLQKQKLTLPLIRLLDQSSEPQRQQIREALARPDAGLRPFLQNCFEQSDALEYARNRASEFAWSARLNLEGFADSTARRILEDLTEFAAQRSF